MVNIYFYCLFLHERRLEILELVELIFREENSRMSGGVFFRERNSRMSGGVFAYL